MKKHWNIAICDDDRAALNILRSAVEQAFQAHEAEASVEVFPGPAELLKRMGECRFDLLFLDIEISSAPSRWTWRSWISRCRIWMDSPWDGSFAGRTT